MHGASNGRATGTIGLGFAEQAGYHSQPPRPRAVLVAHDLAQRVGDQHRDDVARAVERLPCRLAPCWMECSLSSSGGDRLSGRGRTTHRELDQRCTNLKGAVAVELNCQSRAAIGQRDAKYVVDFEMGSGCAHASIHASCTAKAPSYWRSGAAYCLRSVAVDAPWLAALTAYALRPRTSRRVLSPQRRSAGRPPGYASRAWHAGSPASSA